MFLSVWDIRGRSRQEAKLSIYIHTACPESPCPTVDDEGKHCNEEKRTGGMKKVGLGVNEEDKV